MLKNVPGVIHPELLHVLASMGHGDDLVIADANFPAASVAKRLVRSAGISATDLTEAVLQLFPLDEYVDAPLGLMATARPEDAGAPALKDLATMLARAAPGVSVASIERFEFYERARNAFAVVATSDARPYANVILTMGVIPGSADGR
jgi:L-fucose mutarotase